MGVDEGDAVAGQSLGQGNLLAGTANCATNSSTLASGMSRPAGLSVDFGANSLTSLRSCVAGRIAAAAKECEQRKSG